MKQGLSAIKKISIKGARTHNLANINLELPKNRLIVITGLSGSGKSSLAFDTIFAEGQRKYIESLSAYARQFLGRIDKPDVDHIDGLSPAIAIEQKSASHNPRSTVGTVTEIHDYLRLLFARVGTPQCPRHGCSLEAQTISEMVDQIMAMPQQKKMVLLAPLVRERKGEFVQWLQKLKRQGFLRVRIDGLMHDLDQAMPQLDRRRKHSIDVVVDRFVLRPDSAVRLAESLAVAIDLAEGLAAVAPLEDNSQKVLFSARMACPHCNYSLSELEPRLFSFNSPIGACSACDGLGFMHRFDAKKMICNQQLSLAAGAIYGWGKRYYYNYRRLQKLARQHAFSLNQPYKSLSKKVRQIIFYGNQGGATNDYADAGSGRHHNDFPGIIALMEKRLHESESWSTRTELARYMSMQSCHHCQGSRLSEAARHVFIQKHNITDITRLPIEQMTSFFAQLSLPGKKARIAEKIIQAISQRLNFLIEVGLAYLSLDRNTETLSGGEMQRIRLASQIGSGLTGVMYVLDEPSIGLHQRDNKRLLNSLQNLKNLGNTVIVVEHDQETIEHADHVVDMGPGAGQQGGRVVAQGTPQAIRRNSHSLTGQYLCGKKRIELPQRRHPFDKKHKLKIIGAQGNNLKNLNIEIPLGRFVVVTGVSGSGKSTLVNETLYKWGMQYLHGSDLVPAPCKTITGLQKIDKIINIDQSPIGRTPRSNPATYTGLFTPIRELFAKVPEARTRGYNSGRFSFNVRGGRCEACQGDGLIRVEMHFLPDVYVHCDVCHGSRYNRETLEINYKGKNIRAVLDMTVAQAYEFFAAIPAIHKKLQTLIDVGLGYIALGQNATTLSGGEAQRTKLSRELSKRNTGQTLYVLDEPTTGLHLEDIKYLLKVLHHLRDQGNTVIVIEHNLEVIKTADWVIDLGPEGGDQGGSLIACGHPEQLATCEASYTGRYLRDYL